MLLQKILRMYDVIRPDVSFADFSFDFGDRALNDKELEEIEALHKKGYYYQELAEKFSEEDEEKASYTSYKFNIYDNQGNLYAKNIYTPADAYKAFELADNGITADEAKTWKDIENLLLEYKDIELDVYRLNRSAVVYKAISTDKIISVDLLDYQLDKDKYVEYNVVKQNKINSFEELANSFIDDRAKIWASLVRVDDNQYLELSAVYKRNKDYDVKFCFDKDFDKFNGDFCYSFADELICICDY